MSTPAKKPNRRTQLIRLVHVARRELGMDDDTYRQMIANLPGTGGRTSCSDLSITGLEQVLDALKSKGFKVRPKARQGGQSRRLADDPQSRLIRSLWLQLRDAGALRDASEGALAGFVKRLTGVEDLAWLSTSQASTVIESLKKWLARTLEYSNE